jgi:hypothetical protein
MNARSAKPSRTPIKLLGLPTQRVSRATVPSLLAAPATPNFPVPNRHRDNEEPDSDWFRPSSASAKTQSGPRLGLSDWLPSAYFPL